MPEWLWILTMLLSVVSLGLHIGWILYRRGPLKSARIALQLLLVPLFGAFLLGIPLFYLLYAGTLPRFEPRLLFVALDLTLPGLWAHLAVYAWGSTKGPLGRYAIGLTYLLTLPAIFIIVRSGWILLFRHTHILAIGLLFLTGIALWMTDARANSSPDSPGNTV